MLKFYEFLENESMGEWFRANANEDRLDSLFTRFRRDERYKFIPEAGIFIRPHFHDNIKGQLGYTVIDIVFPRPSDLHVHEKMGEAVKVLSGAGIFLRETDKEIPFTTKAGDRRFENIYLEQGSQLYVPAGEIHGFCPDPDNHLEIEVACTEIYDDSQETTITPFDRFQPWIDHYR